MTSIDELGYSRETVADVLGYGGKMLVHGTIEIGAIEWLATFEPSVFVDKATADLLGYGSDTIGYDDDEMGYGVNAIADVVAYGGDVLRYGTDELGYG